MKIGDTVSLSYDFRRYLGDCGVLPRYPWRSMTKGRIEEISGDLVRVVWPISSKLHGPFLHFYDHLIVVEEDSSDG